MITLREVQDDIPIDGMRYDERLIRVLQDSREGTLTGANLYCLTTGIHFDVLQTEPKKFKIDSFVVEANFSDSVPRLRLITTEAGCPSLIQCMLLVQAVRDSMVDEIWALLQENIRQEKSESIVQFHSQNEAFEIDSEVILYNSSGGRISALQHP